MRTVDAGAISSAVERACVEANRRLPPDVEAALRKFRDAEPWPPARDALERIIANFETAGERALPICQDTGMACVFLEVGREVHIAGDPYAAVNEGVRRGYTGGFLRSSVVLDPLERRNSGDNTPALIYTDLVEGDRIRITVAPKGFGSENKSRIAMLKPEEGLAGVIDFVVSVVEAAGADPCPPIVAGVGLGGSFDRAALLAKRALLRPLGKPNADPRYARLEAELLERINALGIGPQGFGGMTTCLGVAVETYATHIAGLPCAVNINCHASRHAGELI